MTNLATTFEAPVELPPEQDRVRSFLRNFFRRKVVLFGTAVITIVLVAAIFAPAIAPFDPYKQSLRDALQQPSKEHLLGTDPLGRDVLSRIIFGTRTSLAVGIVSVGIGAILGMALGLVSGYFGGWLDTLIMRFVDALLMIPSLIFALAFGAALGGGLTNVMLSLGIALTPIYARVMRGQVLTVKDAEYIVAAEAIGCGHWVIMKRHILPNSLPPLIVLITFNLGIAILAEAGLSFLGLGIDPPGAAWGAMVSDGYQYLLSSPVLSFAPGFCIILVVLAFNLIGDGLRDALDPQLRGRY